MFKNPWAVPKAVLPYGSPQAQQYNINSGAPVGKPTYMDQLASFGKTQPASPTVAAYTGTPYSGNVPRDTYARSATPYTGNVPHDTYTSAVPDINGNTGVVNNFGQSSPPLGEFSASTWGVNTASPTIFSADPAYGGGSFPGSSGLPGSTGSSFIDQMGPAGYDEVGMANRALANKGGGSSGNWWDSMLGKKNTDGTTDPGWGGLALGAANGLMSGYMGMKQYGLAKDTLESNKQQFALNYGAQKTTTNNEIDAQNTRRRLERPDLQRDQKLVA